MTIKEEVASFKKELDSLARFSKLLFPKTDPEMTILKGHLLLEEKLRELLDMKLPSPQFLEDARLTTHQVICLAEALFRPQAEPWLWDVLHRLNKLRNDIAHKVQPRDVAERMRKVSEVVKAEIYPKTGFGIDRPFTEFCFSILLVFAALSTISGLPAGQSLRDWSEADMIRTGKLMHKAMQSRIIRLRRGQIEFQADPQQTSPKDPPKNKFPTDPAKKPMKRA